MPYMAARRRIVTHVRAPGGCGPTRDWACEPQAFKLPAAPDTQNGGAGDVRPGEDVRVVVVRATVARGPDSVGPSCRFLRSVAWRSRIYFWSPNR